MRMSKSGGTWDDSVFMLCLDVLQVLHEKNSLLVFLIDLLQILSHVERSKTYIKKD